MNIERKFTSLKDLEVIEEGPGSIQGYRSVFGLIDEGGDIVVKGAFTETLSEYLHLGFTAQSHDWTFKEAVGFPIEAKEDDYGWWVNSQFHSTEDAQNIRIKARERLKAGKQVGFSFGYAPKTFSYIEAKDYESELPKYIKADLLPAMLKKAQDFNRIRVLKSVEAIEDSIVTAPMNKRAAATGVKSEIETKKIRKCKPEDTEPGMTWCLYSEDGETLLGRHATRQECVEQEQAIEADKPKGKGMLAEEMAQTTPSTWEVESALRRVIRKIAETAKDSDVTGVVMDWRAKVTEAINEYAPTMTPIVIAQIEEFLTSSDDEFYLKGITGTESFESFEAAGTELTKFAQKMRSNHELRQKEGRVLSSSNRAKVQACKESMTALIADLDDLLAISEPKPKEKEAEKQAEFDLAASRAQSARLRNHALRTLARIA